MEIVRKTTKEILKILNKQQENLNFEEEKPKIVLASIYIHTVYLYIICVVAITQVNVYSLSFFENTFFKHLFKLPLVLPPLLSKNPSKFTFKAI